MNILIFGGTGSLGNKLVDKYYNTNNIYIYSRDEYKQFMMQEQFSASKYPFFRFFLGF